MKVAPVALALALAPAFALVAVSCGPAPTPPPAPPSNTAAADRPIDPIIRGRYVGVEVGVSIAHFGRPVSQQRLPHGLESISAINVADGWHFTVARRGADLVILLVDERGVVADDVAMRGRGGDTVIVGDCPDSFIGVAPARACDGADTASADIGWNREGSALVRQGSQACNCELLNLD